LQTGGRHGPSRLPLFGDVALKDDEPVVHAHAVVGKKDGASWWSFAESPYSANV
jgi:hypothetical protein